MEIANNSYSDLLNYFDSRYGGDTERTNYAYVIKSMKKEHEVDRLVDTYNKVLKKLLVFAYGSEERISELWVLYGLSFDHQRVWDGLKAYLNDQIKRVFDETSYSDKFALECIVNLRGGRNEAATRKYIASKSSEKVNGSLQRIMDCLQTIHDAPRHMSQFKMETNEYREYKPKYIEDIKHLIKKGYHKGYNDECYEKQTNISYFPDSKTFWKFILSLILIIPIVFLFMHFAFVGFVSIIIILALFKMIK